MGVNLIIPNGQFISNRSMMPAIVKEAQDAKTIESGIKPKACELAAELVSFMNDHPCLRTDTFSIP